MLLTNISLYPKCNETNEEGNVMLIDRGKHSLRLEYSKCNTENEANLKG